MQRQGTSEAGGATSQAGRLRTVVRAGAERTRPLDIPAAVTLHDLAALLGVDAVELIKIFMRNGYMFTINQAIEHEIAGKVAAALGFQVKPLAQRKSGPGSLVVSSEDEDPALLESRPPVVTILGHVDHGKTTLLDTIRKTKVAAGEAGGITQHIGAYQVEYRGSPITFVDTPGHQAFTAMRARGAQVTDVAVIVVAADDGIMPQTLEAIDHVRAASVPIIVAINKIDRPDADPERVKRQLAEHELLIEEWGGDVIAVPVSARTGEGIEALLENILAVSEVGELKANPHRPAQGVVIEARRDRSRGSVATVLVQTGTLRVGDNVVVGTLRGRVRALVDEGGERIDAAGPSMPVEVLGLEALPEAGQILTVLPDERTARREVEDRKRELEAQGGARGVSLEDVHTRLESGQVKALNVVLKTDVQGTVEPVRAALEQLNTQQTRVNIIHAASGSITDSDVMLAAASEAIVIGFNIQPQPSAHSLASQEGVQIRFYDVIYTMAADIEGALEGLRERAIEDVVEGVATIRAVFHLGKRRTVAGFYVNSGRIARGSILHVLRGGQTLHIGQASSLKHFKEDVREVTLGFEGGVAIDGFSDYQEGDIVEAHRVE